jgi:hypothetical protein
VLEAVPQSRDIDKSEVFQLIDCWLDGQTPCSGVERVQCGASDFPVSVPCGFHERPVPAPDIDESATVGRTDCTGYEAKSPSVGEPTRRTVSVSVVIGGIVTTDVVWARHRLAKAKPITGPYRERLARVGIDDPLPRKMRPSAVERASEARGHDPALLLGPRATCEHVLPGDIGQELSRMTQGDG